ncbi:MAG: hypothetical protein NC120_08225 [Ruminococcus sp.]|nr:hypothetical protein [Ruminococcus sp.]
MSDFINNPNTYLSINFRRSFMRRKQFLAILTACTMLFGFAGCQGDDGAESVDTVQVTEQTAIGAESTSENITAMLSEIEQEIVLPPNMTMDDLLNTVQINGKTLTMPTTLNNIMALDNGFSYSLKKQYRGMSEAKCRDNL